MLTLAVLVLIMTAPFAGGQDQPSTPAKEFRPTRIWNRTGPLGEIPKHTTDFSIEYVRTWKKK